MPFNLANLHFNESNTWGPPAEELTIEGQPFQLYFKDTPLEPVDWYSEHKELLQDEGDKTEANFELIGQKRAGNFKVVEDEARIQALEIERRKNKRWTKRPEQHRNRRGGNAPRRHIQHLPNSCSIRLTNRIAEITQQELAGLTLTQNPTVVELVKAGRPRAYDAEMDRVSVRAPKLLDEKDYDAALYRSHGISNDPVLRRLVRERQGKVVVITDEVLAVLMTSTLSTHPWHVKATRYGNMLVVEKDEDSDTAGNIEYQWVAETATSQTAPTEDNPTADLRISALGEESTRAHNCFIRGSCLSRLATIQTEANPFPGSYPRLYSYRSFTLHRGTPDQYEVLVRCQADSVMMKDNEVVRLFGLMEQPRDLEKERKDKERRDKEEKEKGGKRNRRDEKPPASWREELARGMGSGLAKAFDTNRAKIARWITMANLVNASLMKIGFLTRTEATGGARASKDIRHVVLGVQTAPPDTLAAQFSLQVINQWAQADRFFTELFGRLQSSDEVFIAKPREDRTIVFCEVDRDSEDDEEDEEEESEEEGEDAE